MVRKFTQLFKVLVAGKTNNSRRFFQFGFVFTRLAEFFLVYNSSHFSDSDNSKSFIILYYSSSQFVQCVLWQRSLIATILLFDAGAQMNPADVHGSTPLNLWKFHQQMQKEVNRSDPHLDAYVKNFLP